MSSDARGIGRIYQPSYRDKSGERKHVRGWWVRYGCRKTCGQAGCSGVHQENSHSDNRRVAERLLRKRLGEVGLGKLVTPDVEKTTFEDLAKMIETDYAVNKRKSSDRLKYSLVHLRAAFGAARALAITTDRIKEFIKQRQQAGAANGTIACELACLKRMFVLAHQAGGSPTGLTFPRSRPRRPGRGSSSRLSSTPSSSTCPRICGLPSSSWL